MGAQNVYPIVLILIYAGRAWTGQQDELCEAVKVGHMADSLQHQNHDDQAQEEVGCRDSTGAMGGLRPQAGLKDYQTPWDGAVALNFPLRQAKFPSERPGQGHAPALCPEPATPLTCD